MPLRPRFAAWVTVLGPRVGPKLPRFRLMMNGLARTSVPMASLKGSEFQGACGLGGLRPCHIKLQMGTGYIQTQPFEADASPRFGRPPLELRLRTSYVAPASPHALQPIRAIAAAKGNRERAWPSRQGIAP